MSDWTPVCRAEELPPGSFRVVDVDEETEVAVFNVEGKYYAIEDLCTHEEEKLTDGPLEGCEIVCPRHGARFDVRTGQALTPPAFEPTATFPVKVEDGIIWTRDDRWD